MAGSVQTGRRPDSKPVPGTFIVTLANVRGTVPLSASAFSILGREALLIASGAPGEGRREHVRTVARRGEGDAEHGDAERQLVRHPSDAQIDQRADTGAHRDRSNDYGIKCWQQEVAT